MRGAINPSALVASVGVPIISKFTFGVVVFIPTFCPYAIALNPKSAKKLTLCFFILILSIFFTKIAKKLC